MSKREVIDCDRCGDQAVVNPVQVSVVTGRSPDAAGGPSEDDIESLDLCSRCAAWAFGMVARHLSHSSADSLIKEVKAYRAKHKFRPT